MNLLPPIEFNFLKEWIQVRGRKVHNMRLGRSGGEKEDLFSQRVQYGDKSR